MFIKFDVNAVLVPASARLLLAGKVQALSTPGNPSRFLMARSSRRTGCGCHRILGLERRASLYSHARSQMLTEKAS